jgi:hypothetical protein
MGGDYTQAAGVRNSGRHLREAYEVHATLHDGVADPE